MSKSLNNKIKLLIGLIIICIIMCLFNMISYSKAYGSGTSTVYTRDELSEKVSPNVFLQAYPVGSIYITTNSENPGDTYGGTWESYGTGKTLVGLDTTQTEFNTINKVGGEKTHLLTIEEMPSHSHLMYRPQWFLSDIENLTVLSEISTIYGQTSSVTKVFIANDLNAGGSQPHNNLQPYIVVNMWKRIA